MTIAIVVEQAAISKCTQAITINAAAAAALPEGLMCHGEGSRAGKEGFVLQFLPRDKRHSWNMPVWVY